VPVAKRHLEPLGQVQHHLGARARAAGLDEAQVTRGDARLERELELAEAPPLPPLPEHRAHRRPLGGHGHRADRSRRPSAGPLPPRSWTRRRGAGIVAGSTSRKEHAMQPLELVESYLDAWNETDPDVRRAAVAKVWAEDGTYVDPLAAVAGRDEIS